MSQNKPYPSITYKLLKAKRVDKITTDAFPKYFGGIFTTKWGGTLLPGSYMPMLLDDKVARVLCDEFSFDDLAEKLLDVDDVVEYAKNREKGLERFKKEIEKVREKMGPKIEKGDHYDWLEYTKSYDALFKKYHWECLAISFCRLYRKGMSK